MAPVKLLSFFSFVDELKKKGGKGGGKGKGKKRERKDE